MDVNVKKNQGLNTGFTLIEILVVIGIIAILAAVVLIAINPARQFAQARDSQRTSNVQAILNSIGQNMADNKGKFICGATIDATVRTIRKGTAGTDADLRPCIVPKYMSEIPYDPTNGANTCVDTTPGDCASSGSYDTVYTVVQDATTKRITVTAPDTEIATPDISITR